MAAAVPTIGAFNGAPLNLNGSGGGGAVLASSFLGTTLKKVMKPGARVSSGSFRVAAEVNEKKQTSSDRWGGLVEDVSDDQQDITRGKGLVDSLFQAPTGMGTHDAILSSYEYISQGLRDYGHLDNKLDGLYISPSFMDKLVVHISKNFMTLPNIKILIPRVDSSQNCESNPPQTVQVRNFDRFDSSSKLVFVSKSSLGTVQVRMTDFDSPQNSSILILLEPKTFGLKVPLILGIWGGKGQGKSFQCELVFRKMGINPIMMSAGELESGNAGEPAKLIRQRYREAADLIKKGKMCILFINDLDAGAGRMGGTTQYTVNNQMVNATLMNIADNPTNVQLPGMYN